MKLATAVLVSAVIAVSAQGQAPPPYTGAIVMEPQSRTILYDENAHEKKPIASMTKMMTLLITLDEIEAGRLSWDDIVTTSAKASNMGGSQVYLKHNEQFSVSELVEATMVHSANDAAMALAERIAGSDTQFVEMMNARAKKLGLQETEFHSPHGLPARGEEIDDQMSPHDLAILGSELMNSDRMRKLAVTQTMPFRDGKFIMYNPNHLLKDYPFATGIKTGYHEKAGFCVTASAKRDDLSLVAVVVGSRNKKDNFGSAARLFNEAFAKWEMRDVVKAGQLISGVSVPVNGGTADSVAIKAGGVLKGLAKKDGPAGYRIVVSGNRPTAPVSAGQEIGTIIISKDGKEMGRVPALASEGVEEAGWFSRMWSKFSG